MKSIQVLFKDSVKKMARIRSKHSNLLNYFIHDRRDLSPAYVKSCEKFLKGLKQQATSNKRAKKALDRAGDLG